MDAAAATSVGAAEEAAGQALSGAGACAICVRAWNRFRAATTL
jgi:hypothetical protein